jgi:hypothetical protein
VLDLVIWTVVIGMGVFILAVAVHTSRSNGPGSGFRGYTTGYRVMLWGMYLLGAAHIAYGAVKVRDHFSTCNYRRAP